MQADHMNSEQTFSLEPMFVHVQFENSSALKMKGAFSGVSVWPRLWTVGHFLRWLWCLEAKRECDGTHLAPSAMSTFFVEYPCVPHVCVPVHCSWELLFALRSQNMAAGIHDSIAELTWPSWLACLAARLAGWLAGWLVSLS